MRALLLHLILCAVVVSVGTDLRAQNEPQRTGGIVAIVGDTVITQADLDRTVNMQRDRSPSAIKPLYTVEQLRVQHQALRRIIDDRIILHLVKAQELKDGQPYITDGQIDKELKLRVKQLKDDGFAVRSVDDLYRVYRDEYGLSRKRARQFLKDKISVDKYMWAVVFRQQVENWVTPQEARFYYKANMNSFSTPQEITFRGIFIKRGRPDSELAIDAVTKGLAENVEFMELAQTYDEAAFEGEPERAARRKTRSFAELKGWLFPIPQHLARTPAGKVTPRIDTAAGTHFFKVDDVVAGTPKSYTEALDEIQDIIRKKRRRNVQKRFLDAHREKTTIQVFLPPIPGESAPGDDGKKKEQEGDGTNNGGSVPNVPTE